jgi:3'-phosphoadenosine 5'-phosphosulfate (PAPS) 3'-phosphatase
VLDPIDGTRGFVGMRQYAVCLGMLQARMGVWCRCKAGRQAGRQTDRQAGRQTDRQAGRSETAQKQGVHARACCVCRGGALTWQ